jgi:hypothetical protein
MHNLKKIIKKIIPNKLLDKYYKFRSWLDFIKFDTCSPDAVPILRESLIITKNLDGDYYEFGVYKGYLLYKAYKFANELNIKNIKFYGFDSFEGLPEIRGIDKDWKFKKGQYSCSIETVKYHLTKRGVSWNKIFLIKGFFSNILFDQKNCQLLLSKKLESSLWIAIFMIQLKMYYYLSNHIYRLVRY